MSRATSRRRSVCSACRRSTPLTELYAGARLYQLDRVGEDFDDIYALMTGAQLRF